LNRTIALEAPNRRDLRRGLQIVGIVAVVCSAAAFLTGMNKVGSAASERSSSHPKGPKEQQRPEGDPAPTALPSESERVEAPTPTGASGVTSFAVHASAEPA
jgi:hypothetical protein